jgi:hypothetical protein
MHFEIYPELLVRIWKASALNPITDCLADCFVSRLICVCWLMRMGTMPVSATEIWLQMRLLLCMVIRSRVLLEKLIVDQLFKKFPAFYANRNLITVFT